MRLISSQVMPRFTTWTISSTRPPFFAPRFHQVRASVRLSIIAEAMNSNRSSRRNVPRLYIMRKCSTMRGMDTPCCKIPTLTCFACSARCSNSLRFGYPIRLPGTGQEPVRKELELEVLDALSSRSVSFPATVCGRGYFRSVCQMPIFEPALARLRPDL